MPVTVNWKGVPVEVTDTDDRAAALQSLEEFQQSSPQQFAQLIRGSAMRHQETTGMSEDDINALVKDFEPEEPRGGMIGGAGHQARSMVRGALQTFREFEAGRAESHNRMRRAAGIPERQNTMPVSDFLGLPSMEKLEQEEQKAREEYRAIDQGLGLEDVGELLPQSLLFLGGGSLALGKRLILGTAQGTLAGLLQGRTEQESARVNAAIGGALGPVGQLFVGGPRALANSLRRRLGSTRVRMANMIQTINRASGGNPQQFTENVAETFMRGARAEQEALTAMVNRGVARQRQNQAALARTMRDTAGSIIQGFTPRNQTRAAQSIVNKAYQDAFTVQNGVQQFSPTRFVQRMGGISDNALTKMGIFGRRMREFRRMARALEEYPNADANIAARVFRGMQSDNAEAGRMLRILEKLKPEQEAAKDMWMIRIANLAPQRGPVTTPFEIAGRAIGAGAAATPTALGLEGREGLTNLAQQQMQRLQQ